MSAHVLLNLLNRLGKSDKMQGLPSIISLSCNEFDKFNNTCMNVRLSFITWHQNYLKIAFLS